MTLTARRPSKGEAIKDRLLHTVQDGEGMTRVNFELEKMLARKLKVRCAEEGKTMSEVLRSFVVEYLK